MNSKPYIIAELSGNHNGDINRAFQIIEEAHKAGASAVKIQTYTADTITINHDGPGFNIKGGLWDGYNLYQLYQQAHTPWEWHKELFDFANKIGITLFSTPFDESAVDFLEELGAPLYKVASFELTHLPLIRYIAEKKKPMIMSTGMASFEEIQEAVTMAIESGCDDLTLLHCVSEYPAPIENSNLATMLDLKVKFPNIKVGLSDHTLSNTVAIAAVALGAQVVEKHFTLSRLDGGVDSAFSLEPHELKYLCEEALNASLALGTVNYSRSAAELGNKVFRRSIYATDTIRAGECFTEKNIKVIRPGLGLEPKFMPDLLNHKAMEDYKFGDPISINEIKSRGK